MTLEREFKENLYRNPADLSIISVQRVIKSCFLLYSPRSVVMGGLNFFLLPRGG